jgi:hypothetical protein
VTNRLFDPDRPPVRGFWQRFALLEHVGDYIVHGPTSVFANDTEGPAKFLQLEECVFPVGDKVAFGLYITQGEWAPSPDAPLVRRVIWRRGSDRLLSQHGTVLFPDVAVSIHRMARDQMALLERLAGDVGSALGRLSTQGLSLDLKQRYEEGLPGHDSSDDASGDDVDDTEAPPAIVNSGITSRIVDFLSLRVDYMAGFEHEAVDNAFLPLWEFLSGACIDANVVECEENYHGLTPDLLAIALRQVALRQLEGAQQGQATT